MKAGKLIETLQKMSFPKAFVCRNSEVKEINSHKVVPCDILILDAGRFISSDIRLIESADLQIEESALTGEFVPSDKKASQVYSSYNSPLGECMNMAFMSTLVIRGREVGNSRHSRRSGSYCSSVTFHWRYRHVE